jgi:hypothetical protein
MQMDRFVIGFSSAKMETKEDPSRRRPARANISQQKF